MKNKIIPEVVLPGEFEEIPITVLSRSCDANGKEDYTVRLNDIFYFDHHVYYPPRYSQLCPELTIIQHMHPGIEILYVKRGMGYICVGEEDVSPLYAGDIAFVNAFEPHYFQGIGEHERICVTFLPEMLMKYLFVGDEILDRLVDNRLSFTTFIPVGDRLNDRLRSLIDNMVSVISEHREPWKLSVQIDVMSLVLDMITHGRYTERPSGIPDARFFRRVMQYINTTELSSISAASIAESLDYSEAYFCRKFKLTFGQSFIDYLNNYKIICAKKLIRDDPDITVAQISASLGFSNPSYFSQLFRRQVGVPPSQLLGQNKQ